MYNYFYLEENNTIVFDIDNCEEISQKEDEISQEEEISQDETSQHATSEEVGGTFNNFLK